MLFIFIINKKFYDGLPADLRAMVDSATKEATTYANSIAVSENASALEKIIASKKSTIYTPTAAEINEWKKALMPVHHDMETRVGKATIEGVYKEAGFTMPK